MLYPGDEICNITRIPSILENIMGVNMHGLRLDVAQRKAEKVFKKYEGFSPRNRNQPGWYYSPRLRWTKDELERILGIYRKTKVPCSCHMCGNPRNLGYITMREVRQHLEADSQYEEVGWNHRKLRWLKGWLD